MENVKLSPRLRCMAELVPSGARLADVGTDHGYLPISLLGEGRIQSAVATDLRPGPLERAEENKRIYGAEAMRCVLCDGLLGVAPGEVDTVAIAGLGGETIAAILAAAPWAMRQCVLLLQPMSKAEILRAFLLENGLEITEEKLVEDGGKLYRVLRAGQGSPVSLTSAELYTGAYGLVSRERLFPRLLKETLRRIQAARRGAELSGKNDAEGSLAYLRGLEKELEEMEERYAKSI